MPSDTTPEALAAQTAAIRRLGPEGRLRVAVEMSEAARAMAIEGIRRRNPELTEAQAKRQFVSQVIASCQPR